LDRAVFSTVVSLVGGNALWEDKWVIPIRNTVDRVTTTIKLREAVGRREIS